MAPADQIRNSFFSVPTSCVCRVGQLLLNEKEHSSIYVYCDVPRKTKLYKMVKPELRLSSSSLSFFFSPAGEMTKEAAFVH
jgi:hypothetical protein